MVFWEGAGCKGRLTKKNLKRHMVFWEGAGCKGRLTKKKLKRHMDFWEGAGCKGRLTKRLKLESDDPCRTAIPNHMLCSCVHASTSQTDKIQSSHHTQIVIFGHSHKLSFHGFLSLKTGMSGPTSHAKTGNFLKHAKNENTDGSPPNAVVMQPAPLHNLRFGERVELCHWCKLMAKESPLNFHLEKISQAETRKSHCRHFCLFQFKQTHGTKPHSSGSVTVSTLSIQVVAGRAGRGSFKRECAQGDRPARCPNHFFAVNEPFAASWW